MEVRSVTHSRRPAYPDKDIVLGDPDLLRSLPERWKRNAAACAALAATSAMLLAACTERNASAPTRSPTADPNSIQQVPLFEHGAGRGEIACVAVSPPVFLTEEDACTFIKEVAKQNGLDFSDEIMISTTIPVINWDKATTFSDIITGKAGELHLDGYDQAKKVAFEFVSANDIESWRESRPMISSTGYPVIDAAKMISENMARTDGGITVGVFYDPVTYSKEPAATGQFGLTDEQNQQLQEQSKEQLRKQVLDFIAWLKAQGII